MTLTELQKLPVCAVRKAFFESITTICAQCDENIEADFVAVKQASQSGDQSVNVGDSTDRDIERNGLPSTWKSSIDTKDKIPSDDANEQKRSLFRHQSNRQRIGLICPYCSCDLELYATGQSFETIPLAARQQQNNTLDDTSTAFTGFVEQSTENDASDKLNHSQSSDRIHDKSDNHSHVRNNCQYKSLEKCPQCESVTGPNGERVWVLPEDLWDEERSKRRQRNEQKEQTPAEVESQESYYDILQVERHASNADIKRSYRRLAAMHHPDRPGGSNYMFLKVSKAYEVLSDPERRAMYDEGGQKNVDDLNMTKAMEQIFGGGENSRWHDVIGTLSFIREVNSSIQTANTAAGAGGDNAPAEQNAVDKEELRKRRVATLMSNLQFKLNTFALNHEIEHEAIDGDETDALSVALDHFEKANVESVQDLLGGPYGKELCRLVGHIYCAVAQSHSAYPQRWTFLFGLDSLFARMNLRSESFGGMIRLVRKAYAVKSAYGKIDADPSASLTETPEKRAAEEAAASAALEAMWEGIKLELLSVISEVSRKAISENIDEAMRNSTLSRRQILERRLLALHRLGTLFQTAELSE